MKTRLLLIILLFITGFAVGQETERRFIYFNYNDDALTPEGKSELDEMFRVAAHSTITKIELYGYTDSVGDESANLVLSENRVAAVRAYLVTNGIDEKIIQNESFGERNPAYTNDSEAGRRKNRRVEVVFTYVREKDMDKPDVDVAPPSSPVVEQPNVQHAAERLTAILPAVSDTQYFTLTGDKEIVINGKQGTVIKFYGNCFEDVKGKTIKGNIDFQLIEVYSKSDMVTFGLSTVSDGKMLESGGMIYINATYNGQPAYFSDHAWAYQISFPTADKKNDMRIFYADSINGPVNWKPSANSILSDMTYMENQKALDEYVFNSTEMGWINCDRFIGKAKLTDVFVDMTDTAGVSFALVFKDINSAMASGGGHGDIGFYNVPIGYAVTLIAFRKNENSFSYYSKDLTIAKNHRETVVMEQLTEEEFEKRLKELD